MNKDVAVKFDSYPADLRPRLEELRRLIFAAARNLGRVPEETLKWGEPAYLVQGGSTVRFDWKPKRPEFCAVYFICNTKLVETFREIYPAHFEFEGNRALLIDLAQPFPQAELQHCLEIAFSYHRLKHLPLLGV